MNVVQSPEATIDEMSLIAETLLARVGLNYRGERLPLLASSVQRRMKCLGIRSLSEYLTYLSDHDIEWERLTNLVSVTESSFYRHPEIISAVMHLLRALHQKRPEHAPIQIWSAAAAEGQEPYTLAMAALETGVAAERRVIVWATDINTDALKRAQEARYPGKCATSLPPAWQRKYLTWHDDRAFSPAPPVRELVRFRPFNLKRLTEGERPPFTPDIIVCANVLIYFPPDLSRQILVRLASLLPRDGALFVDKAVAYLARDVLVPVDIAGTVGYRLPARTSDAQKAGRKARHQKRKNRRSPRRRLPPKLPQSVSPRPHGKAEARPQTTPGPGHDTPIEERDILALLDRGQWREAEERLRAWQQREPLAFEPYFLLARLYRMREEWQRARECYERALYLCPSLAVGHLEYGNLLRRLGNLRAAHSAYQHALQAAARDRESQRFGFSPPLVRRLAERALFSMGSRNR